MPQTPYSTLGPVKYTHIATDGTVFVNTGAIMSLNINSFTSGAAVSIYDTVGTITGTVQVAAIALGTIPAPTKVDLGPPGAGLMLNTGTVAVVMTGTADITLGHR